MEHPYLKNGEMYMSFVTIWPWIGFNLFVLAMLAIPLLRVCERD